MLLVLDNLEQVVERRARAGRARRGVPEPAPARHLARAAARPRRGRVRGAAARRSGRGRALLPALRPRADARRSRSSAAASTTCRSRSSSPPPGRRRSRPEQILERLGERLDLFKGGRDAEERQKTLRATIEWSHDLLSPEEQRALRPARRLRRRLHARGGRGGRRRRPRHDPVARREEPAPPHGRPLLDARDDPRVRRRAPRGGARGRRDPTAATPSTSSPLAESANLSAERTRRPERPELVRPEADNIRAAIDWASSRSRARLPPRRSRWSSSG